jgi:hypothetical protein
LGGEFHPHAVAQQDTDVVPAHFAREVSQYLVAIVKPYAELGGWQCFNDGALYVYFVFFLFTHYTTYLFAVASMVSKHSAV